MNKTNIGLVAHCEKALREKWFYLWGDFGRIATQALIDNNIRQYPSNERWRTYVQGAIGKTRVCDCYGLVKGYLWWTTDEGNPKYNSKHDTNTAGAFNRAKEKGSLSTLPEIPGIILYMQGHVGVYVGKGRFIELMGNGVGAFEGAIVNSRIIKGSKFTHWFKDINIDYSAKVEIPKEPIKEELIIIEDETKGDDYIMYVKFEDVPVWGKDTIKKLMDKELLKGNEKGELNLTESMLRGFIVNDRAGLYN